MNLHIYYGVLLIGIGLSILGGAIQQRILGIIGIVICAGAVGYAISYFHNLVDKETKL